jgi:flagellar biosynthesis protein FliQ
VDSAELPQLAVHALYLVLVLSAPSVIASLLAGILMAFLLTITRVTDHSLAHLPKLLAVGLALAFTGSWMSERLVRFTVGIWESIPRLMR